MTTHMRTEPIPAEDPREDKLPVWAQDRLRRLRRLAQEAQEVARDARLETDPEGSHAVLDVHGEVPVGLGKDPEVTFYLEGGESVTVRRNRQDPFRLEVSGSRAITLRPRVANVVEVTFSE